MRVTTVNHEQMTERLKVLSDLLRHSTDSFDHATSAILRRQIRALLELDTKDLEQHVFRQREATT